VSDDFTKAQLGQGVVVVTVPADSLGQTLGLRKHDLIKTINGRAIESVDQVQDALDSADKVQIEVIREGKPVTLKEE
jgi:S1-C subfamily serine protease